MQELRRKSKENLIRVIVMIIAIVTFCTTFTMAYETDEYCLVPEDNQYFELRAVEVKAVEGQNKQVIMELWGNNIEFKRIRCTFFL